MFHSKKRLHSFSDEDESYHKICKKKYFSKKKTHSKHSHSRKKKWEKIRLKNSTFKHGNYGSEFIGSNRITKCVGILAKGKISDSISRLEKNAPRDLKASSVKDLHRVLQFSNDINAKDHNSPLFEVPVESLPVLKEHSSSSDSGSYSPSPLQLQEKKLINALNTVNSQVSSVLHPILENSVEQPSQLILENSFNKDRNELFVCREIITKKLHAAIKHVNKVLFPGVSNQDIIKKEFLQLKGEYNSHRKVISNSSNCESSQENSKKEEPVMYENFKLNPVLTQESVAPKNLESMFPNTQEFSSSDSDFEKMDERMSALQNDLIYPYCVLNSETLTSSNFRNTCGLKPSSPNSSGESSVWEPDISPIKFVPNFPPTPQLYFRQKMF